MCEDQSAETGDRLGRVFSLKIRMGRAKTNARGNNPGDAGKNGDSILCLYLRSKMAFFTWQKVSSTESFFLAFSHYWDLAKSYLLNLTGRYYPF